MSKKTADQHFVYLLRCQDNTLYTGYTTNPDRRLKEHNNGEGARYTSARTPVELVYKEAHDSRSEACRREYEIKQLTKDEKENLVCSE